MLNREQVLDALSAVRDPDRDGDLCSLAMISGLQISTDGDVVFMIEVDPQRGAKLEPLRQEAERVVASIKGVGKVSAVLTSQKAYTPSQSSAQKADPHGMDKNPALILPIKHIVAVASGKGGVGKSTVAAALAKKLALNSQLKVGLLDADIYGPSQPKLMGLEGYKPEFTEDKQIIPPVVDVAGNDHGLKVMSIGFMVDANKALVWRGPMVQSAIYQLFRDVQWAEDGEQLDVLIVDMPPGTGDAQLTLAQKVPVSGAVIVSTPQDLALADARKGVEMFKKTNVPILGLIENMSTHICSNCGHEEHIFGHGGARAEAEALGVPFLGEVPLSAEIRKKADAGESFDLDQSVVDQILQSLS
jgi:ATP-binding protein involved in chromosome partitioning